jgi:hypothetical protein
MSKIPPKGSQYGNYKRADYLETAIIDANERLARAYMRLQASDVPRDPWHWEVSKILHS